MNHRGTQRANKGRLRQCGTIPLRMLVALAVMCVTARSAVAPVIPEESGVLMVSDTTLQQAAEFYNPLLVLFDAPTRAGSLTLFLRFADAASALRIRASPNVRLAMYDLTQAQSGPISEAMQLMGLPVLVRFRCFPSAASISRMITAAASGNTTATINGTASDSTASSNNCSIERGNLELYQGGRTSAEMQRYMLGQPPKTVVPIHQRAELDQILTSSPFVVLFVVDGFDSLGYFDATRLAQLDMDQAVYVATTNPFLLEEPGLGGTLSFQRIPSLVIFRASGQERIPYDGVWTRAAIATFIRLNKYSVVSTYSSAQSSYFYDRGARAHILLFTDTSAPYYEALLAQFESSARQYYTAQDNLSGVVLRFVLVSAEEETLRNAFVVTDEHLPSLFLVQDITRPPKRLGLYGEELLYTIETDWFQITLSAFIEETFPPFVTSDGGDLDGEDGNGGEGGTQRVDWMDYSDILDGGSVQTSTATLTSASILRRQFTSLTTDTNSTTSAPMIEREGQDDGAWDEPHALIDIYDVTNTTELLAMWQSLPPATPSRLLAFLYSPRCFSCRLATTLLDQLVSEHNRDLRHVDRILCLNVDQTRAIHKLGLTLDHLPGIFLLLAPSSSDDDVPRSIAYTRPSDTDITMDSLITFLHTPTYK